MSPRRSDTAFCRSATSPGETPVPVRPASRWRLDLPLQVDRVLVDLLGAPPELLGLGFVRLPASAARRRGCAARPPGLRCRGTGPRRVTGQQEGVAKENDQRQNGQESHDSLQRSIMAEDAPRGHIAILAVSMGMTGRRGDRKEAWASSSWDSRSRWRAVTCSPARSRSAPASGASSGGRTFGLSLLPLVIGCGLLFFDGRSRWGLGLLVAGAPLIVLLGIVMNCASTSSRPASSTRSFHAGPARGGPRARRPRALKPHY